MRTVIRELTHFVLIGIAVVTVVSLMVSVGGDENPVRGHGEMSVTVILICLAAVALLQLLILMGRSHPDAWRRVDPLFSRPSGGDPVPTPHRLREWEAALVSASTGGARLRLRQRLVHRLTPLVGPVAAELETAPHLSSDQLFDRIERMLDDTEESRDH